VLWLLTLLAMAGAMTYQLIRLTKTFISWPVKTSVNLAFSPLTLPSVTFCNTNPIRQSRVHALRCDLQAVLRVDDKYRSPECINQTYRLNKSLSALCSQYYWFCTGNDTEDVDAYAARKKRIQLEIVKEDREMVEAAGHQIQDMVVSCNFKGIACNLSSFFRNWNMEYGNCYTLNTSTMQIFDSGPPSGLDIVFNLEIEESLRSFKTGYGMRVVVHEQGTRPFPSSDGMTISAAVETHFGLRLEEVTRLGGLYGDCRSEIAEFTTQPYSKYSIKACRNLCLEKSETEVCGCTDPLARVATPTKGARLCFNASEREVCSRAGNDTEVSRCIEERAKQPFEQRESSFLRLRLYFETLNYEQIKQEPFYD
ncbi:hypothetical protein BaRGS_00021217, partial [Batillaria attramentaria]